MSFHHRMEGADLHPPSRRFVENNNASSIPFLRAVTFSGFGDRPEIFLADGATNIIRGVSASTLLASTVGIIVQIGLIEDADTTGFIVGDILYADASGLLSTVVNGPAIAEVLEINASTGVIYVDTSGGGINASSIPNTDIRVKISAVDTAAKFLSSALVAGTGLSTSILSPGGDEQLQFSLDATTRQLNDVSASTPVANDLLIFSSAAGTYVPRTLTAGSNIDITVNASQIIISASVPPAGASVLGDLTDVAALPRTEGAMMSFNASAAEFQFDRVAYTDIGGEPFLTLVDPTRSDKVLSVESTPFTFGRNKLNNNDWLRTGGNAGDAESGVIVPRAATIVRATGHCADADGNTQTIELYVGASSVGVLGSVVTASTQAQFNNSQDIDVASDTRIRMRAGASAAGQIEDTIVTLWMRWRG